MKLEDFTPAELTDEVLDKLTHQEIGLTLEQLLEFVQLMGSIQKLLEGDLYLKRFNGLIRSTSKENPMDCSYVRMCVIDWLKRPEEVQRLIAGLKLAAEKV